LQVATMEAKSAQFAAPTSWPANNAFFLVRAIIRSFCPCRSEFGSPLSVASLFRL
jgi:hypothetical protein